MSGSVCSKGSPQNCGQCEPANQCRDTTVPFDTCCENFQQMKTFSTSVVNKLDEFPGLSQYSVVQFADFGSREQGLRGADKTGLTIANLQYSGGLTNHKEVSLAVILDLASILDSSLTPFCLSAWKRRFNVAKDPCQVPPTTST